MEQESNSGKSVVRAILPWIIAAAALAFFLVTLNHWASIFNLDSVSRINGWDWIPSLNAPLFTVMTYPFHWLPAGTVPLTLNLFSALCAALTLGLLARSVALLPHNKTDEQRQRLKNPSGLLSLRIAWLPLVLAVTVCGLQLTFWEHATCGSPEMFDLLIFAYVIRCLLEYRIDQRPTWLTRSAVIYGLGMTNNGALIGFFPLFIAALVWMMGWQFFNIRFLVRMALLGLAGLSLYLLLPLLQVFSHTFPVPFWQGLKATLVWQKSLLFSVSPKVFVLLGLTSLVPILLMSIRWPSNFGDPSPLGVALTTWTFHLAHAFFLVACIWVAFDPEFSPRHMVPIYPFLTLYYLAALSVGYFSGYFLLVFSKREQRADRNRPPPWLKYVYAVVNLAIWLLLGITVAGLIYKNFPSIRVTNGPELLNYSMSLIDHLPSQATVISDDPNRLRLAQAALARTGRMQNFISIDAQVFKWPEYHKYLHKRFGANWPEAVDAKRTIQYDDIELVHLMLNIASTHPLWYLHSSFGYYFESFYSIPRGLTFEMQKYPAQQILPPPLPDTVINENDNYWKKVQGDIFSPLLDAIATAPATNSPFREYFMKKLHLKTEANVTATYIGTLYSLPLNNWGVELQKADRLTEASNCFAEALKLNPNNIVTAVNGQVNKALGAGHKPALEDTKSIEDKFGDFRSWAQVISRNGPFDDPTICMQQGKIFAAGGLIHQAIILLTRVTTLAPYNLNPQLVLARLYLYAKLPDPALKLISEVHNWPSASDLGSTNQTDLLTVESIALFMQNKTSDAQRLIGSALQQNPDNAYLLNSLFQVSLDYGDNTDALFAADRLLRMSPDDTALLVNKGYLHMQLGDLNAAIAALDRALTLETNNYKARFNRAISYFRAEKFDAAKKDYEILQKVFPDQFQINYGLGEIAYRRHDTNAAIQNYEIYLQHASTNTAEAVGVSTRLKELKGGNP